MNKERHARLLKGFELISKIKQKKENRGIVSCPLCENIVEWVKSDYNGHVHLKCRTNNCLTIIE